MNGMLITRKCLRAALVTLLSGLTLNAYAVAPGFYIGGALGPATNDAKQQTVLTASGIPQTTIAKPYSMQWASHFYLGNKINEYVAGEFGFTFFSSIGYSSKYPPAGGLSSRVRDIDLVAKLSMPVRTFEVYAKAGPAFTYLSTSGGLNTQGKTKYLHKVTGMIAVGADYGLNQNWVIDLAYTTLFTGGLVGRASYLGLGLSYHFVNKYCGQFLCDD
jgi:opacity protein-like surface antigen